MLSQMTQELNAEFKKKSKKGKLAQKAPVPDADSDSDDRKLPQVEADNSDHHNCPAERPSPATFEL